MRRLCIGRVAALVLIALSCLPTMAQAQTVVCTQKSSSYTNAVCFSVDRTSAQAGEYVSIQAWSETRSGSTWSRTYGTVQIREGSTGLLSGGSSPSTSFTANLQMQTVGQRVLYARDSFAGDTPTITITVGRHQPIFSFNASVSTSRVGESITLTSSVDLFRPSGVLAFYVTPPGGSQTQFAQKSIGPIPYRIIDHDSRNFQFNSPFNVPGEYVFVIGYLGDSLNNPAQSNIQRVQVGPFPTLTGLSSSTSAATSGDSVTLTATVSGVNPTRAISAGTVEFYDGTVLLGSTALTSSGVASLVTTQLRRPGQRSVTASYLGDADNQASSSAAILVDVEIDPAVLISIITGLLE